MKKIASIALAALTVGGALVASSAPASAAPYYDHGYYHGGWVRPVYGYGWAPRPIYHPVRVVCTSHWRWDGYLRREVLVRSCY